MTQAELNALVNGLIIDNNTNQVTPAKVRSVFLAVIDSIHQTNLAEVTANAPLNYDAFNNLFTIFQADASTNGYLSADDWNRFNEKQDFLTEDNFGALNYGFTTENNIDDNDAFTFSDVSDGTKQKRTLWNNIKAKLTAVFNALFVPQTRTININGTTQDLSANRSWTVGELVLSDVTKYTHTGTTSTTAISTINIPANYIPNNSVWEFHICGSRGATGVASTAHLNIAFTTTAGSDFIRNANIGTGANFKLHMYRTLIFRNGNIEVFSQNGAGFATDFTTAQGILIQSFNLGIAQSIVSYITLGNSADRAYLDYVIFKRIA